MRRVSGRSLVHTCKTAIKGTKLTRCSPRLYRSEETGDRQRLRVHFNIPTQLQPFHVISAVTKKPPRCHRSSIDLQAGD